MVRRSSQEKVSVNMDNKEEFTVVDAGLPAKEQRNKASYHHRYKTLKAKVMDVVASANGVVAEESPFSVTTVGREPNSHLNKTDLRLKSQGDDLDNFERGEDSRQPSPSLRDVGGLTISDRAGYQNDSVDDVIDEGDDLTDPAEWRKFIESVKKEVAERPASMRRDSSHSSTRQDETTVDLKAVPRTPISFRRLLSFNNKGDKRSEEEESPIKRHSSPSRFRRRSDSLTSTNISDESAEASPNKVQSKNRSSFRIPRFPSPSRRSSYTQSGKPVREDNWEKNSATASVVDGEFKMPDTPHQVKPTTSIEPVGMNELEDSTTKKIRKGRRKKVPPAVKPIPAEIQELNEQILKAVGSAMDDDDTTGDPSQLSNKDTNTQDDSVGPNESNDLLSNIKISTTSGIQVKGNKEKEEMRHQTIARRVLNVLIRPNTQETENSSSVPKPTETDEKRNESNKVLSPSDDDFTDAKDGPYLDVNNIGDVRSSESHKTPNEKIREQLKALKAKTEHITLKKKFEKSQKKHGGKKTKSKTKSSSKSKQQVEKASSYESFESFSSRADGNCFSSILWCFFDPKGDKDAEDEKTLYSDVSLDTYESEWGTGRPLPILSPSDFSAERDDLFDVIEKGLCGRFEDQYS